MGPTSRPKRKLPLAFWLLLLAAIAVALVLVVGTVLENKKNSPEPTPTPAPSAVSKSDPLSPASQPQKIERNLTCSISELSLQGADAFSKSRLVGWGSEPFQLTFWTLDASDTVATLKKQTIAQLQSTSGTIETSFEQNLICKSHQEPGCLYVGSDSADGAAKPVEALSDLWLQNDMGFVFLSEIGKLETSKLIVSRLESGRLMFHESLGLCGQALRGPPDFFSGQIEGRDEKRTLRLFDLSRGGVYKYDTSGANSYSRNENALHPTYAQQASSTGLSSINCRDLIPNDGNDKKQYALRDVQTLNSPLNSTVAFIASGKKTFDSDQEVWILNTSEPNAKLVHQLTNAQLGFSPGGLMFQSPQQLLVSSSNFFQTKVTSKIIDVDSGAVGPSDFKDAWPGENVLVREELTASTQGRSNSTLSFVYRDSKKVAGAIRVQTQTLSLPGTFAPEEKPRVLVSKRGDFDWIVIYQSLRSEPIRTVRVTCSKL